MIRIVEKRRNYGNKAVKVISKAEEQKQIKTLDELVDLYKKICLSFSKMCGELLELPKIKEGFIFEAVTAAEVILNRQRLKIKGYYSQLLKKAENFRLPVTDDPKKVSNYRAKVDKMRTAGNAVKTALDCIWITGKDTERNGTPFATLTGYEDIFRRILTTMGMVVSINNIINDEIGDFNIDYRQLPGFIKEIDPLPNVMIINNFAIALTRKIIAKYKLSLKINGNLLEIVDSDGTFDPDDI